MGKRTLRTFCLIFMLIVLLSACAPKPGTGIYAGITIYNNGQAIGNYKIDCTNPFILINGQQATFYYSKYQLKLISGELVIRNLTSGGVQIDTYAIGESTIEISENGILICKLKVIVKPSPYLNSKG